MEDAETATVLERFDALDRYASLRAVANVDRAPPDGDSDASADEFRFGVATENAFRAGRAVVTELGGSRYSRS